MAVEVLQQVFEFGGQAGVGLFVVGFVGKHDGAITVEGDAVIGVGQAFGSQPKIQGVLGWA